MVQSVSQSSKVRDERQTSLYPLRQHCDFEFLIEEEDFLRCCFVSCLALSSSEHCPRLLY
jgi:hypothetical protein